MPCYIRYLLSAVHTTWFGFKLCGGGPRWRMKMEGRETWKLRVRRRKGAARSRDVVSSLSTVICRPALAIAWLGCIQFNFIFHYLGIYRHINTRLFRDKMTHLSLLSPPHQGGAQLPCLSGNIFMGRTLHFIDRLSTGSGSLLAHSTTTNFDINLSDPDELPHNNTLTCQVAIL